MTQYPILVMVREFPCKHCESETHGTSQHQFKCSGCGGPVGDDGISPMKIAGCEECSE